jgi:hypothetical protein
LYFKTFLSTFALVLSGTYPHVIVKYPNYSSAQDTTGSFFAKLDALVFSVSCCWLSAFQDPYHGPGQAMGLSFSVPEGIKIPSSLQNMFKELHKDLGCTVPSHGNLERWAVQVRWSDRTLEYISIYNIHK